ncbi:MAG: hypothetical protein WCJ05_00855 [bacterium]
MEKHENYEESSLLNELKSLTKAIFSDNPNLLGLMGGDTNPEDSTVAVLSGIAVYGEFPEDRCEVEITNFFDEVSGECFIYLIEDSCFFLNERGVFYIEDQQLMLDNGDLIGLINLIEDVSWLPTGLSDFYGKYMDN